MKIFFSLLFVIAIIATFVLLITSLVFRFKKSQKTKKFLKFTGVAFVLSILSFVGVDMNTTPQEKEAIAKQRAEKQEAKEQKKEEEKKLKEQKEQEEKTKKDEQKKLEEQKKEEEKKLKEQKELEDKAKKDEKAQKEFASYAQNITGGSFIKDMKLNNGEAEITFHDSFASYQSANPTSTNTEEQYKQYFSTGDAIEKIFVSEPARLLRQFPDLNTVKMTLPFDGKTYSTNLDRKSLNSYIGFKIEDLKVEDKSWVNKFNNPYVYDKTKRKAFFEKFVTIQ